uniref:Uncharacterized protein n=2 Tax=Candidatus Kentrum eta TaxID=2126337 RepID=A0A450VWP6_9GAMM|nr:MAG: hypothetical protein BECKH772C_GA0070978_105611 [Candidatus Kentron sp. H]VFK09209.1 MAG: hypothetical protein BECKH772C_GA0070978_105862 [Candidatus Kentron sp. H]
MCVWIVHNQCDALSLGIIVLYQPANAFRPLFRNIIVRNVHSAPILERGMKCQQVRHPIAFVFNVVAFAMARLCRYRSSYFLDALHACFVHANHRMRRFRNSAVNFQHRFHPTYECRIHLQWECTTYVFARVL